MIPKGSKVWLRMGGRWVQGSITVLGNSWHMTSGGVDHYWVTYPTDNGKGEGRCWWPHYHVRTEDEHARRVLMT